MESIMQQFPWLELVDHPAFCVKDGIVVAANRTAEGYMFSVGTNVCEIIQENYDAYSEFLSGSLYLTVTAGGIAYQANITRTNECDIFVITQSEKDIQLQALALAAQKLRIPLSNIITATDQLFSNLNTENTEIQQFSGQINRGLFQLLRIVSNMSDANSYKNAPVTDMQNINLTALFYEIIEKIQTVSETTGKKISYSGPTGSIIGMADGEKLGRAIYNLMANSLKFSPEGSTVNAKLSKHDHTLTFTVRNNCSRSQADYPFWNRYTREPIIEDDRFGLGLGMSLTSSAICSHGGTVLVDNPTPDETRVTITIPLVESNSTNVSSPRLKLGDYAGGWDKGLLELSELLPTSSYKKTN